MKAMGSNNILANRIKNLINEILLPVKLIIPQPIVSKIPGLTTNEDIRLEKVLQHVPAHARCLDIGCGTNRLMKLHRTRGGMGIGLDVYDWGEVDVLVEESAHLPFENKSFDCITFVASLNHIPNRLNVLREAYRLLGHGGMIIITTLHPFVSTIWHRWAFWDRDQRERGMKPGEVYGFSQGEIAGLLGGTGFDILARHRFSWGINNLYIAKKINDLRIRHVETQLKDSA